MAKKMLIDATHPEETRVVVVDGNKVDDFDFESINKRQLAGNIYLAKVTRVEPSLQAAFVEYGGNRHGFLAFSEIHPDYYQIPMADREALLEEERREEEARRAREEENDGQEARPGRKRRRNRRAARDQNGDDGAAVAGLEVIDIEVPDEPEDPIDDVPRGLEIAEPEVVANDMPAEGPLVSVDLAGEEAGEEASPESAESEEPATAEVPEQAVTEVSESGVSDATQAATGEAAPEEAPASSEAEAAAEEAAIEEPAVAEEAAVAAADEPGTAEPDQVSLADGAEESVEDPDQPPRNIAEAAGLDDDERVVGDVDGGSRTISGDESVDTTEEEPVADPDGQVAAEPGESAERVESAEDAVETRSREEEVPDRPETAAEDVPSDRPEAAAEEVVEGQEGADAPAPVADSDAESDETTEAEATNVKAETNESAETGETSTAVADGETGEETGEAAADAAGSGDGDAADTASDEAPAEETKDDGEAGRGNRRSRRRRGRGRRNGREASAEETRDEGDEGDADADDDDGPDEPEAVGAEDTLEEAARARTRLRRRYKIQDVVKVRQIMLVQVVKEERGNKGAALTTYLSLAGRYCVLMPNTARGGGISRKITNAGDRKRLREIIGEMEVPQGMGLIVRTAGAERTKAEIRRDYEFLLRQWEQIRDLTLKSIAPTLIYEEGSLIKRSIRDIYNKEIEQILVEGEAGYREAKEYMKMLMPSHAKNVQPYGDAIPLFSRYQVESYLNGMFNPTVQLKSGGYIVIGVTEALVAIDVNSGRATKQGSIEETALQTNLEAADEVARQLRLRDLAGLIVIDFIDMDENRNNRAVEKRMKERLKTDRARIQVGRISAFGLMEMSRQRLRPGMLEATTQPCPACHGTGLIRSDESLTLSILRELEEEGLRGRANELILQVPIDISNYLVNTKREHLAQIEQRHGISIMVMADPALISPHFEIERSKSQRPRPERQPDVITAASVIDTDTADEVTEERDDEDRGQRRRRGRRGGRRRKGEDRPEAQDQEESQTTADEDEDNDDEERPKRRRGRRRGGRGRRGRDEAQAEVEAAQGAEGASDAPEMQEAAGETESTEAVAEPGEDGEAAEAADTEEAQAIVAASSGEGETAEAEAEAARAEVDATGEEAEAARVEVETAEMAVEAETETIPAEDTEEPSVAGDEPAEEAAAAEPTPESTAEAETPAQPETPAKPKRRGWWSLGR